MIRSLFAAAALLAFVACSGIVVPPDKKDYIGKWEGPGITLVITADGGVHYVNVSGGGKKELNASVQSFEGDNFVVGALGFNTTFVVTQPPQQAEGTWTMVVDGNTLTRVPGSW